MIQLRMSSDAYNNAQGHYMHYSIDSTVADMRRDAERYAEEYNYKLEEINFELWTCSKTEAVDFIARRKHDKVFVDWFYMSDDILIVDLFKFADYMLNAETQQEPIRNLRLAETMLRFTDSGRAESCYLIVGSHKSVAKWEIFNFFDEPRYERKFYWFSNDFDFEDFKNYEEIVFNDGITFEDVEKDKYLKSALEHLVKRAHKIIKFDDNYSIKLGYITSKIENYFISTNAEYIE